MVLSDGPWRYIINVFTPLNFLGTIYNMAPFSGCSSLYTRPVFTFKAVFFAAKWMFFVL